MMHVLSAKMSWVTSRKTTRVEDQAYCLMGLSGVNTPPLYGEDVRAFIRLQLEILRISDDESIFAWRDPDEESGGILARSPMAFQHSGDIVPGKFDLNKPAYSMTNKGYPSTQRILYTKSSQTTWPSIFVPPARRIYSSSQLQVAKF
jgi:hypothetical protein